MAVTVGFVPLSAPIVHRGSASFASSFRCLTTLTVLLAKVCIRSHLLKILSTEQPSVGRLDGQVTSDRHARFAASGDTHEVVTELRRGRASTQQTSFQAHPSGEPDQRSPIPAAGRCGSCWVRVRAAPVVWHDKSGCMFGIRAKIPPDSLHVSRICQ